MSRSWPALLFAVLGCLLVGSQAGATVFVQPINVCDDNGNNCALSTGYAPATSFNELATQLIYANAGVDVQFLVPVKFSNTAFLNPGVVDDTAHGYTTGSPTDPAHQLLDLPGHGQNQNRSVLNFFVVNTLPHTSSNLQDTPGALFGLGLLNANGTIVTTGATTGADGKQYIAPADNVAHELGHNLGLTHTDSGPLALLYVGGGVNPLEVTPKPALTYPDQVAVNNTYNLLDSGNRNVLGTPCGVIGVICNKSGNIVATATDSSGAIVTTVRDQTGAVVTVATIGRDSSGNVVTTLTDALGKTVSPVVASDPGSSVVATTGAKDLLLPFQQQQLQATASDLFNVGLAHVIASASGGDPNQPECGRLDVINASPSCFISISIPTSDSKQSLLQAKIRFNGTLEVGKNPSQGVDGACSAPRQTTNSLGTGGTEFVFGFDPGCFVQGKQEYVSFSSGLTDFTPFSFEFDFADGLTSVAAFSQSGTALVAMANMPIALSNTTPTNTPNGPGLSVPTDPATFNAYSTPETIVTSSTLGGLAIDVPEPASAALLLLPFVGAAAGRVRRCGGFHA